jgi:hypothetical protein
MEQRFSAALSHLERSALAAEGTDLALLAVLKNIRSLVAAVTGSVAAPFFRSFGAGSVSLLHPRLAPWATFWHRFAVSEGCNLFAACKTHVS